MHSYFPVRFILICRLRTFLLSSGHQKDLQVFALFFQEYDARPCTTEDVSLLQDDLLEEEIFLNLGLRSADAAECVSVRLHDYCGLDVSTVEREKLPKDSQTENRVETSDASTQTEEEKNIPLMCSSGTQTINNEQKEMATQVKMPDICIEDISDNEKCMFYTGIPNKETFFLLFDEFADAVENTSRSGDGHKKGRPRSLRLVDEFFMVLLRLRLGLLLEDLSYRFKVSKSTCSLIINGWISYLSVKLISLTPWLSKSCIKQTMPEKFRKRYPNCRVIIDCTEFYTQNPQSLTNKTLMFSHYKSHMTWKALLGISPSGVITFVSDMWTGGISDKQLTMKCGILDLCEPGDAIMADKGFQISDLTAPRGLHLIIPPMKFEKFNRRQVEETRRIANLRIDVERAMERVKNFRILQGVMPINMSHQGSDILKICVGLSNLLPPLVHDSS